MADHIIDTLVMAKVEGTKPRLNAKMMAYIIKETSKND